MGEDSGSGASGCSRRGRIRPSPEVRLVRPAALQGLCGQRAAVRACVHVCALCVCVCVCFCACVHVCDCVHESVDREVWIEWKERGDVEKPCVGQLGTWGHLLVGVSM